MEAKTRKDMEEILGEKDTKLLHWLRKGALQPEERGRSGKGNAVLFNERDVLMAAMTKVLVNDYGLSLLAIKHLWDLFPKAIKQGEKIGDFFDNDDYGPKLEVIYIHTKRGAYVKYGLHKVTKKNCSLPKDIVANLFIDAAPAKITVAPLGKVRTAAKEMLSLK